MTVAELIERIRDATGPDSVFGHMQKVRIKVVTKYRDEEDHCEYRESCNAEIDDVKLADGGVLLVGDLEIDGSP